ncbi:GntR family transcriptional regulator [Pelotomaculum propionicicum]|uniref:HTH-type transcriptional repressor YvoA n=1 Tax=Pelotomaculum propionicicum TaxID=258475 RepID=A0A4Y7RXK9_9FIRM|nr:GntR family transcriptional regulator [Pelotomaculum propionicicum]NLI14025.1 GntR family transcriptional regulator [Peptococcaceae bacterium]TEB13027.1 HTH-type transcriptional repressor YvoA [Pelotomaculum propionicicum]
MKSITPHEEIIDKYSIIPIYYQLFKILEKNILDGKLKPGEALPPEHEIAEKYGISRMTVRRAISELISAGMVYSQKGKGNFVARPKLDDFAFELVNFYEEIQKRGMKPGSKLLGVKIVRADELLAGKLEIDLNATCLHIRMVLSADDEPLVYENKYVVYTKQKPILENELKDPSLSNLATIHGDHFPIISKRVLQASIATEEEALILGTGLNMPVFVVEQTVYDTEKKPIGWGKSIYRGDRYKLTSYIGWSVDDIS